MLVPLYTARCTVHRAALVASAVLLIALAQAPVRAETGISLPLYDVPVGERGQTLEPRGVTGQQVAAEQAQPGTAVAYTQPLLLSSSGASRFNVVELPPDAVAPGTYKRPHHGLGYRWAAAESWLRDHGVDAQTCYLPMVRMHTSISRTGVSGTLWLYGRCAFR